jgi:transcriptional antiterminator
MGGKGSGKGPIHTGVTEQGKMRRLMTLMKLLFHRPVTVKEIGNHLDCSVRTAYRLIATIQASGYEIECTMDSKYFLVREDQCPCCGNNQQPLTKVA